MMKIQLPDSLQTEIRNVLGALEPGRPIRDAVQAAENTIVVFHREIPKLFADHNADFLRARQHALSVAESTDAFEQLVGLRHRVISLQNAPGTPENVAWLKALLTHALEGSVNLRTAQAAAKAKLAET